MSEPIQRNVVTRGFAPCVALMMIAVGGWIGRRFRRASGRAKGRTKPQYGKGVLMTNERITLSVLALTFLMPWTLGPDASVVAAEKPAPNVPPAKSYVYTVVQQLGVDSTLPAETMKVYWAAPGKSRSEAYEGSELSGTTISSISGPGISINHTFKTYQVLPAQPSSGRMGPGFFDERLGRFAGQADRDLGTRQIGDRPARGFEIAMAKIDPDMPPGIARIWVDQQSGLPAEMEYAFEARGERCTLRLKDIRWNVELDPKLFELVAPQGYVKRPRHMPPMEEQLRSIIKALRIYVELFGDHYPKVTRVDPGRLLDEMFKKVGIDPAAPPSEQARSDHHKKILVATTGFAWLYRILVEVPDAAYYGKTVGPNDKNRVLARWRLDDGKYQAIYGDLRTETVTAESLGLDAPETDEAGSAPAE